MRLEAFVWGSYFECGIPVIDTQHRCLVDLVNRLGEQMVEGNLEALKNAAIEVRTYINYHCNTEEAVWQSAGLGAEELARHTWAHREFSEQLEEFVLGVLDNPDIFVPLLHNYLVAWLTFHILGEDREIARVLLASREQPAGSPPASMHPMQRLGNTESVLLEALQKLYEALAGMNEQLRRSRNQLETRVAARTRDLQQLNDMLKHERDELAQANARLDETRCRLIESEKMASIGQLAAGVAHEINNPIGFVSSNLGTLGEYLSDIFDVLDAYAEAEPLIGRDPQAISALRALKQERGIDFVRKDVRMLLTQTKEGLGRVRGIVHDLRVFSHVDRAGRSLVNLHEGLISTVNIVLNEIRQKAELRREFADVPPIVCNSGEINQVFLNLLMNSVQAIERQGMIAVRLGADGDGGVWFEVEDDGCGMSEEVKKHIFEPFYTTKPVGVGTGLGLSLAWKIVENHAGRITVDSAPGRGTRIRVWLPLGEAATEEQEA